MVTLTKKEQILGLKMLKNPIQKSDQKTYISHAFYHTICKLKGLGLIQSERTGRNCTYRLTDDGNILFSILASFKGNEDFKINALKGTKIISFS